MENVKRIAVSILIVTILALIFSVNVQAITAPSIKIVGTKYSVGDKISFNYPDIQINETKQLYAIMAVGNEMGDVEERGWSAYKTDLTGLIWKSSDESIATIDQNGLVTALKEGTVTITVEYEDAEGKQTDSINQKIIAKTESNENDSKPSIFENTFFPIVLVVVIMVVITILKKLMKD